MHGVNKFRAIFVDPTRVRLLGVSFGGLEGASVDPRGASGGEALGVLPFFL